jgi:hypothetical protein
VDGVVVTAEIEEVEVIGGVATDELHFSSLGIFSTAFQYPMLALELEYSPLQKERPNFTHWRSYMISRALLEPVLVDNPEFVVCLS